MDERENTRDEENYEDDISDAPDDSTSNDEDIIDTESSPLLRPRRKQTLNVPSSSEDSEDEPLDINLDWTTYDPQRNNEDFEGVQGINCFPNNRKSVADVTGLFIGDDLFDIITEETNRYHTKNQHKYKTISHTSKWVDVTNTELKRWFGLVLIMGLVRKNSINEYWSTNPKIETPYFRKAMSRNRFKQIMTFIHFSNNDLVPEGSPNRLIKIQNIIEYFSKKFKEVYTPNQNLSLDEGMIPWRGRLKCRVYNPMKIVKYGILNRMVCESVSGYICNFKLYSGIASTLENTITDVLSPYLNKWYHIYADNYYNSVRLANKLLEYKTRICGTIRKNRGLPTVLKNAKLKKYETIHRRKGDVLLHVWKTNKKRDVRMISTIHQAEMVVTEKKDQQSGLFLRKPRSIIEYNKYMNGVDIADQYLSYNPISRKTFKWTKKATLYLFHCALFNSFRVFQKLNPTCKFRFNNFLLKVADAWLDHDHDADVVGDIEDREEIAGPSFATVMTPRVDPDERLSGIIKNHVLIKIISPKTEKPVRRNCKVCTTPNKRKLTFYMCKQCKVPLHAEDCFQKYHTKKNIEQFQVKLLVWCCV